MIWRDVTSYHIPWPLLYRYGHTAELARLAEIVQEKYPASRKILVGFSMGGNIVGKYLGEVTSPSFYRILIYRALFLQITS